MSSENKTGTLQMVLRVIVLCLIVVAVGWGMSRLESHVRETTRSKRNTPVRLQVSGRPSWMPAELAYKIAKSFATHNKARYDDVDLTDTIAARAGANPWVRKVVSVRKARDPDGRPFVRVDCEFRKPAAMVAWRKRFYFVDDRGIRLKDSRRIPEVPRWTAIISGREGKKPRQEDFVELADVPRDAKPWRIHYIIIELDGEMDPPAPKPGELWDTKALEAGLKLTALLKTRKYGQQITRVDVRNYAGRRSTVAPHLSFSAGNSDFKFGRFPHLDGIDYNVSTRQKMKALDDHVARYRGRLAGTPGMNLQLEDPYE
ncbi:MAG: hypothetical protein QGH60_14530 [Phycisphaerae bacterium]|jgi:hypothetical protein|nr:hypothetical protein [Phycisphaerae bacterium]